MDKRPVHVYDYKINTKQGTRVIKILGHTFNQAENYLIKRFGNLQIEERGHICKIDTMTSDVAKMFGENYIKSLKK